MNRPVPTYFNGGPFEGTIRMIPAGDTFTIVADQGRYELDGFWGALRQFTWKPVDRRSA